MKQTSFAQAEFAAKKKTTRRERILAEMEQVVPWSRLLKALSPYYYPDSRGKRGRPPIPLKRILRMYFVQQWYALRTKRWKMPFMIARLCVTLSVSIWVLNQFRTPRPC